MGRMKGFVSAVGVRAAAVGARDVCEVCYAPEVVGGVGGKGSLEEKALKSTVCGKAGLSKSQTGRAWGCPWSGRGGIRSVWCAVTRWGVFGRVAGAVRP